MRRERWATKPIPERTRQILAMRVAEGMTYRAIGERLGISGTRVRQIVWDHMRRAAWLAFHEPHSPCNWVGEGVPS